MSARGRRIGLMMLLLDVFVSESRIRVGLLALPLCGAAVTFFARDQSKR
jgi:hypothetical protein